MHYLFLDESYPRVESGKDFVFAAWAVEQEDFLLSLPRLQESYVRKEYRSINSVDAMLQSVDAWAVVSRSSLDSPIYRTGEVDGTDDVSGMARCDNIWSVCATFTVAKLITALMRRDIVLGIVDIYHDPKDLTDTHRQALHKTLRMMIVQKAKQLDSHLRKQLQQGFQIGRIDSVAKARSGQRPDEFQFGTWIADALCSRFRDACQTEHLSRIVCCDTSDVVRRTVQQFDGKSFYEN